MPKYLLEKCCFCVDLRTGCFIIGYLNLLRCVTAPLISVMLVIAGTELSFSLDPDESNFGVAVLAIGIINLLIDCVLLASAIALLIGLHKRQPRQLMTFIVYCGFSMVLSLILFIVNLAVGPYYGSIIPNRGFGLTTSIYFLMVIRSYYYQMLDEAADASQCNI